MQTVENFDLQIEQLRPWVEAETGMDFSGSRFARLRDAVRKVNARSGAPNAERVAVQPQQHGSFLESLTAELTIGETFFFRNEHHFEALREHVIPQILRDNAAQREIRIWSAGCASGEEPYSVAILLDQVLNRAQNRGLMTGDAPSQPQPIGHSGWSVSILGTDLNPEFLQRAREACFRAWSFRLTKIHEDMNYFSRQGDAYFLHPRLRQGVRFAYLNLVKDVFPSPLTGTLGLDLILFRNVAIYLKPPVTAAILERFCRALRPGGWLLLGETEVTLAASEGFESHRFGQATFFRKRAEGVVPKVDPAWRQQVPILPSLAPLAPLAVSQPRPIATPLVATPFTPTPFAPTLPGAERRPPSVTPATIASRPIDDLVVHRNFAEAERTIERISNQTQRASARLNYVRSLLTCAEIPRARQMLERCLREDSLLIEAQLLHASFAEESGDLQAAEQSYRRALYIDRNCCMAHFHLALVQQQAGDAAAAARSLNTTLKLSQTKDPQALVEHGEGVCYGRLREMATMMLGGAESRGQRAESRKGGKV